jgi:integrase
MMRRFGHELNGTSLRGNPATIVRAAIRGWNAAADRVPGWPQQRLTPLENQREGYVLRAESFPLSFQHSLAGYIAFLTDPPDEDDAPLRGLRPSTLAHREFQFRQMASALVHRGVPVEAITDIGALARREHVDMICAFFMQRHGGTVPEQLGDLLAALRPVALYQLKDRDLADWIRRRLRRLAGGRIRRFGITEKNRRRIAVFQDPKHVRDLLLLPYRLLKRAESGSLLAREAAILVRAAVAIELEIMCPIRLQNLSEIDVDTDLARSRSGKGASVNLFIPGKRTKNGEDIELELPRQSVALIDLYLAKYRNQLILPQHRGSGPRYLFPRPDGTAKVGRVLASTICTVMQRELGMKFNVHLFRHLDCFLYLKSHPGQIDVMRRVLGHRDGETTRRFYAFVEQSQAFQLFDEHILRVRDEALRPSRKAKVVRKAPER